MTAISSPDLRTWLDARRRAVDEALDRVLPAPPVAPPSVCEAMRYSVMAGGKRLQLRAEMFNVFNMRAYPTPQTDSGSAQFGQIGGGRPDQMKFPRRTQIGIRYNF